VRDAEPTAEELEEQGDAVADFVEELLDRMGIDAIAEPVRRGDRIYVDIVDAPEEDLSLLIGRHGQTLDAIQELTRMIVGRRLDRRIRVIVDVDGYRQRREEQLAARGRDVAEQVRAEGGEVELEPMNPFERKIVHDAVAEVEGVESLSRGEEPNRYVVVRRT
jgi:spoIIIJ-associated protein